MTHEGPPVPSIAALALAGTTVGFAQRRSPAQIDGKDLLNGLANPSRWLMHSGNYASTRHSPLTQITPDNVARLAPAWSFDTGLGYGRQAKFEATPIAIDGTLYVTGLYNHAWAIDGRTGTVIWHYERPAARRAARVLRHGQPRLRGARRTPVHGHARRARDRARPQDGQAGVGRAAHRLPSRLLLHRRAARGEGQADRRHGRRRVRDARLPRRLQPRPTASACGASTPFRRPASPAATPGRRDTSNAAAAPRGSPARTIPS